MAANIQDVLPKEKVKHKKVKPMERHSKGENIFNVFNTLLMVLFTFLCAYPFYYIFINTISDNRLSSLGKVLFIPKGIHLETIYGFLKFPILPVRFKSVYCGRC